MLVYLRPFFAKKKFDSVNRETVAGFHLGFKFGHVLLVSNSKQNIDIQFLNYRCFVQHLLIYLAWAAYLLMRGADFRFYHFLIKTEYV